MYIISLNGAWGDRAIFYLIDIEFMEWRSHDDRLLDDVANIFANLLPSKARIMLGHTKGHHEEGFLTA